MSDSPLSELRDYLKDIFNEHNVDKEKIRKVLTFILTLERMFELTDKEMTAEDRFLANIEACIADRRAHVMHLHHELEAYVDNVITESEEKYDGGCNRRRSGPKEKKGKELQDRAKDISQEEDQEGI